MMKIQETPVTAENPFIFVEWDKVSREPSVILGGLTVKVHLPDLIERLDYLRDELTKLQKGSGARG